jgi:hypothetical protein
VASKSEGTYMWREKRPRKIGVQSSKKTDVLKLNTDLQYKLTSLSPSPPLCHISQGPSFSSFDTWTTPTAMVRSEQRVQKALNFTEVESFLTKLLPKAARAEACGAGKVLIK